MRTRLGSPPHPGLAELLSLCSIQPRFTTEQAISAIQSMGPVEASDILGRQRCRSIVVARLTPFVAHGAVRRCLELLEPRAARIRHMHGALDENLDRISGLAQKADVRVLAFKGLGARGMYAEPARRDFGDLDLFVKDRAQATVLARAIRQELEYTINPDELPWLKYDSEARLVYGQINLLAPSDRPDFINIDIHFGDYSVRHSSRLRLDAHVTFPESPGLSTMAFEENLASGVNNAAGDHFVTMKDVNDILSALALEHFDWGRFQAVVEQACLGRFFGFMLAKLRLTSNPDAHQEELLGTLSRQGGLERAPRLDRPDWGRRCWATTAHAFMSHRSRGLLGAIGIAYDAYGYYREPLRLTAQPGRETNEILERFDMSTCVRLVPVELGRALPGADGAGLGPVPMACHRRSLAADPGIVRTDAETGTFLEIDGERFVATVSYRVPTAMLGGARVADSLGHA